jgi:hypothetical protein
VDKSRGVETLIPFKLVIFRFEDMKKKEQRFYLPLLSLSSKNLDLEFGLKKKETTNDQITNLGYDFIVQKHRPSHMRHKKWCRVFSIGPANIKCTCLLQNNSKPAENLVRVEYNHSKMLNYLKLAGFAKQAGADECTDDILYCLDKQMNMDPRKRAIALTYPCLQTEWNKRMSKEFIITTNDMFEKDVDEIAPKQKVVDIKKNVVDVKGEKAYLEVESGITNQERKESQNDKEETSSQEFSQNQVIDTKNDENQESFFLQEEKLIESPKSQPDQDGNMISEDGQDESQSLTVREQIIENHKSNGETVEVDPFELVPSTKGKEIELGSKTSESNHIAIFDEKDLPFFGPNNNPVIKGDETTAHKTGNNEPRVIHFGIETLKIGFLPVIKHNQVERAEKYIEPVRLLKAIPMRTYFISQNTYGVWCRKNLKTFAEDEDDRRSVFVPRENIRTRLGNQLDMTNETSQTGCESVGAQFKEKASRFGRASQLAREARISRAERKSEVSMDIEERNSALSMAPEERTSVVSQSSGRNSKMIQAETEPRTSVSFNSQAEETIFHQRKSTLSTKSKAKDNDQSRR